mgnify:CR=1 FL=1
MTKIEKKNVGHAILKGIESSTNKDLNPHSSLKNLLVSHDKTLEDKIATVKTAQLIDKVRVETAFKTLMKR